MNSFCSFAGPKTSSQGPVAVQASQGVALVSQTVDMMLKSLENNGAGDNGISPAYVAPQVQHVFRSVVFHKLKNNFPARAPPSLPPVTRYWTRTCGKDTKCISF